MNENSEKMMAGLEDGLVPNEVVKGHGALKAFRKDLGFERFRSVMRMLIMPNRYARPLERATYIETEEEIQAIEDRFKQALDFHRQRIAKK